MENELQPDALLRLDPAQRGQSTVGATGYVEGPPEQVVEIAASSASYDLHSKRRVYARSGVQEYIAIQMYERRVDWFVLREGVHASLQSDEHGVIRSEVFPGLWLQPVAIADDPAQAVTRAEIKDAVLDAIASLSEPHRLATTLFYINWVRATALAPEVYLDAGDLETAERLARQVEEPHEPKCEIIRPDVLDPSVSEGV